MYIYDSSSQQGELNQKGTLSLGFSIGFTVFPDTLNLCNPVLKRRNKKRTKTP
jgi:hypothetical protein